MRLRRFRKLRRNRNYATMVLVAFVGILSVMGIGYSYLQQRLSMDISLSKKEDVVPEYLAYVIASKNVNGNAEGLYEDDFGNIRYRGSNDDVKNYVIFNGEMWRIIGIFNDGNIKLIKDESIGNYAWGSTNNWATSELQSYLNGTFYNSFSDDAKSQITSLLYYLYAPGNGRNVSMQNAYQQERNQLLGQSIPYGGTSIRQNVGLMYPSDYGYASSPSCNRYLGDLNTSEFCNATGNWLFTTTQEWLQTPYMQNTALYIGISGSVSDAQTAADGSASVSALHAVRPVIYLNLNVVWDGGIGTKSRPYKIYGALGPLTTDPINNPMNPHPTSTATTTGTGTGTGGTTGPTTGTGTPTTGTPTTGTPTTTGPTTGTPPGTTTPTGTVTPTTTTPIMTTSNSPVTTPNY